MGRGAAGRDRDQRVDIGGHVHQRRVVAIGHIFLAGATMIDHRQAESLDALRHCLADAAETDDADLAAAQRGGERIIALQPLARAQIAIDLRQLAHRGDQQAQRQVRDLVRQHVRRIGDDEATPSGFGRIDMIVADAEAGDDLELRQRIEQRGVHPVMPAAGGDAAHAGRDIAQQGAAIRRLPEFVDDEAGLQLIGGVRHQRAGHNDLGSVGGCHPGPVHIRRCDDSCLMKRLKPYAV